MRSRFAVSALFLLTSLFVSDRVCRGQSRVSDFGTGGIHTIQGRIYLPNGKSADSPIRVRLESTTFSTITVDSDMNGGFAFRSLAPGNYTVVVDAGDFFEISREYITVEVSALRTLPTPKIVTLPIFLAFKRSVSQQASVINAKLASIPKPAAELYERAQHSLASGDLAKAQAELRQALAAYNPFSLAWNDLGVLLEKAGDEKAALDAFRNAVRFDDTSTAAILNLGCSLAEAKEYAEAEKFLAIALTKDGSLYRGHFYMGIIEVKLGRLEIAEQAFLKAIEIGGNRAAKAHYMLAGVYWATQDYRRAADQLELYLKLDPSAKDAMKTRESISELRKKQKGPQPAGPNRFS